ncbi:hypothetical protein [Pseudomonas sp. TUM22785]|uniref:hypothetical protein n=1 Tax=Pseudomonas sp. TUM22785 TaxID=3019098 RepID=UPI002305DC65|nr:hypothetical protein [Pseudomonas sp. TUM22785]WCD78262.1 hypothetical protein PI990_19905 [Pseudomonas sp. TUM22785]
MKVVDASLAVQTCRAILLARKQYNLEHSILRSHNSVIERLLVRELELHNAYSDLHKKLSKYPGALNSFFGALLDAAAYWAPERIAKAREERDELVRVNQQVAEIGENLAALLRRRDELHNKSGFRSNTQYHIGDLIKEAGQYNGHFTMYLEEQLEKLQASYDLKYWPAIHDCVEAIADDARVAEIEASDPLTEAATDASRSSLADFFKAWFVAIDEHRHAYHGRIPDDFHPTDNGFASFANCALGLVDDDLLDGPYVKRLRQRVRA